MTTCTWARAAGPGPTGRGCRGSPARPRTTRRSGVARSGSRIWSRKSPYDSWARCLTFSCHSAGIWRTRSRTDSTTWTSVPSPWPSDSSARPICAREAVARISWLMIAVPSRGQRLAGVCREVVPRADRLGLETAPRAAASGRARRGSGCRAGWRGRAMPATARVSRLRNSTSWRYDVPVLGVPTWRRTRLVMTPPPSAARSPGRGPSRPPALRPRRQQQVRDFPPQGSQREQPLAHARRRRPRPSPGARVAPPAARRRHASSRRTQHRAEQRRLLLGQRPAGSARPRPAGPARWRGPGRRAPGRAGVRRPVRAVP